MNSELGIKREKARRLIVNLVFVIYWLLIFEGALRKWVFPQYHKYLFFIRDPFVILVYWLAFTNRLLPKRYSLFTYGMVMAVLFLLLSLLQGIITTTRLITLIYGWRMYFFYIPLAFIVGENLRAEDLKRLVKYTLIVAIPLAALVYKQHISPPFSFINKSAGSSVVFTITGEYGGRIVRPTSTFTFFHGQQLFIGSVVAFVFTAWILPREERPLSGKLLQFASAAVFIHLVTSGTRLPYILTALICMAAAFSAFIIRRHKISARAMIVPVGLFLVGMFSFIYFFASLAEITLERHLGAEEVEGSIFRRVGRMFFEFTNYISRTPFLGFGIGCQTAGGGALSTGRRTYGEGLENEWARIFVEVGPLFGIIYIAYRIILVMWLFIGAVRATNFSSNPLPLLMVAFISSILLLWSITNYGTEMGYAWLFAGYCIAANKLGGRTDSVWSDRNMLRLSR